MVKMYLSTLCSTHSVREIDIHSSIAADEDDHERNQQQRNDQATGRVQRESPGSPMDLDLVPMRASPTTTVEQRPLVQDLEDDDGTPDKLSSSFPEPSRSQQSARSAKSAGNAGRTAASFRRYSVPIYLADASRDAGKQMRVDPRVWKDNSGIEESCSLKSQFFSDRYNGHSVTLSSN